MKLILKRRNYTLLGLNLRFVKKENKLEGINSLSRRYHMKQHLLIRLMCFGETKIRYFDDNLNFIFIRNLHMIHKKHFKMIIQPEM